MGIACFLDFFLYRNVIAKESAFHFMFIIPQIYKTRLLKHVVRENMVDGSSMIGFPLVIAVSEWDIPEIKPWTLGCNTSALTNEIQEERQ
jgi:hypothetical protein